MGQSNSIWDNYSGDGQSDTSPQNPPTSVPQASNPTGQKNIWDGSTQGTKSIWDNYGAAPAGDLSQYHVPQATNQTPRPASNVAVPNTNPLPTPQNLKAPIPNAVPQTNNYRNVDTPLADRGLAAIPQDIGSALNEGLAKAGGQINAIFHPDQNLPIFGFDTGGMNQLQQGEGRPLAAIGELAGGTLNALQTTYNDIGKPVGGLAELGLKSALAQIPGGEVPTLFSDIGTTSQDANKAIFGGDFGKALKMGQAEYDLESARNPLTGGIAALFDPFSWTGGLNEAGKLARPIEALQETMGALNRTVELDKGVNALKDASPLTKILGNIVGGAKTEGNVLAGWKELGLPAKSEQSLTQRLFPFAETAASRAASVATDATDTLGHMLQSIPDRATARQVLEQGIQAANEGAMSPELRSVLEGRGIKNTADAQKAIKSLADVPAATLKASDAAHAAGAELVQQIQAGGQAKDLFADPAFQKTFNKLPPNLKAPLLGWKNGDIKLADLPAEYDRAARIQLANDMSGHMATTIAKAGQVPAPNVLKTVANRMKAWQGYLSVSTNPHIFAKKSIWDTVSLLTHGANPAERGSEVDQFFRDIGMANVGQTTRAGEDAGQLASKAAKQGTEGTFGFKPPAFLRKFQFPLDRVTAHMADRAYMSGYLRNFNRLMPQLELNAWRNLPPERLSALTDVLGADGVRMLRAKVAGARNPDQLKRAVDEFQSSPDFRAYVNDAATHLTQRLQEVFNGEKQGALSSQGVVDVLHEAEPKLNGMMGSVAKRVLGGEDFNTAFEAERGVLNQNYADRIAQVKSSSFAPTAAEEAQTTPYAHLTDQQLEKQFADALSSQSSSPKVIQQNAQKIQDLQTEMESRKVTQAAPPNDILGANNAAPPTSAEPTPAVGAVSSVPSEAVPPAPVTESPTTPRLNPDDFKRQEDAFITPSNTPDPNAVGEFAKQLAQEEQVPNVLRRTVQPDEWAQMSAYGRQTALERALAQQRDAGSFGLSDTYQGRGDVPTAMPDVSSIPPSQPAPTDLSDVFYQAAQKGIGTVTDSGKTVNQHLLSVLNKHKNADSARFTNIDNVRSRADEAIKILDGYTPEAKEAIPDVTSGVPKVSPHGAGEERANALTQAAKLSRSEYSPTLSQNVADAATGFKYDLAQGEAGARHHYTKLDEGINQAMRVGTSNPDWYRKLYADFRVNKPAARAALDKIIADAGKDKGVNVERVKEVILQQLADGLETAAGKMEPDAEARKLLGYPDRPAPNLPPTSEGGMSLSSGEPQPLDAMGRLNAQHFEQVKQAMSSDPTSGINPVHKIQAEQAWLNEFLDGVKTKFGTDMGRGATPLPNEARNAIASYMDEMGKGMFGAQQSANAHGRWMVDHTVLNYNHRWNVDGTLQYAFPFTYWALHTAAHIGQDFIDRPLLALEYAQMYHGIQDQQNPDSPSRFGTGISFPMPFSAPSWMGTKVFNNPLDTLFPAASTLHLPQPQQAASVTSKLPTQPADPNAPVDTSSTDNMGDQVLTNLFSIHQPVQLAWDLLSGNTADAQNMLNSIPAARLMRGLTAPFTNGGVTLPGAKGTYDNYYILRQLADMKAKGEISPDQFNSALIQQTGATWDEAKHRSGLENYTIPALSSALGFPSKVLPAGEQLYYTNRLQRDQLIYNLVKDGGGNPNAPYADQKAFLQKNGDWQKVSDFYTQHPELGAFADLHSYNDPSNPTAQDDYYKQWLVGKLWDAWHAQPELKQKLDRSSFQGTDPNFTKYFDTAKPDYTKLTTPEIMGWANALGVDLLKPVQGSQTPNPAVAPTTTGTQDSAYHQFYQDVANSIGWQEVGRLGAYQASLDKTQKAAWFQSPEGLKYKTYLDHRDQFFTAHPDVQKILQAQGLASPSSGGSSTFNSKSGNASLPYYLRPSYDPKVPKPYNPVHHNKFGGGVKFTSTRSLYQLLASVRRRQSSGQGGGKKGAGTIAFRDGAVLP